MTLNYSVFNVERGRVMATFDYLDDAEGFCDWHIERFPKQLLKILGPFGTVIASYPEE